MKNLIFILPLLILSGCTDCGYETDLVIQRELFTSCLKNAPAGPSSVKYNDWSEVVTDCQNVAREQSSEWICEE